MKEILFNDDWEGCKVRFFDLKKFTTLIPKYLGWEETEIPYYNVAEQTIIKKLILQNLSTGMTSTLSESVLKEYLHPRWCEYYELISKPFWNAIRRSEYWINDRTIYKKVKE